MGKRRTARELALKVLFQVDVGRLPLEEVIAMSKALWPASSEVWSFAETLARGVTRKRAQLDDIIAHYAAGWTLERMANVDRNLLRMALYELLEMDDIPYSVSINEAVELAKIYSTAESGKFVNGILGNFARAKGFTKEEERDNARENLRRHSPRRRNPRDN
ncbi:MAG: transcription antitermination factor NusB [Abditibacteriales bacterium]|nr:transcription antitermination factor NusB [Abditibacteriales bacterium]MDW8367856.1 transcription antitermination factor NusB [Abditibacteriales bacterium]